MAVMATVAQGGTRRPAVLAGVFGLGVVVAVSLGVYAGARNPSLRPTFTLGFSGVIQMKVWLTTIAVALMLVQLSTALWMWGRLPRAGAAPGWAVIAHRWSGAAAFVVTLPVAFSCIWVLGFTTSSTRVVVHGIVGCAFYGAYAAKMLGLRVRDAPGWLVPVLGGTVVALLTLLWLTAALWFFTQSGQTLT
jgi:hypothetical protein